MLNDGANAADNLEATVTGAGDFEYVDSDDLAITGVGVSTTPVMIRAVISWQRTQRSAVSIVSTARSSSASMPPCALDGHPELDDSPHGRCPHLHRQGQLYRPRGLNWGAAALTYCVRAVDFGTTPCLAMRWRDSFLASINSCLDSLPAVACTASTPLAWPRCAATLYQP